METIEMKEFIEVRNALIDMYNFYSPRMDDFKCIMKEGEADLIYKTEEIIRKC